MIKSEDTLIVFSNSGETVEVIDFLRVVRNLKLNNKVLAITASEDSTISQYADITILTHVNEENNDEDFKLVPTTSTTVALVLGDALTIALQKLKGFKINHFLKNHPGGQIGRELIKN